MIMQLLEDNTVFVKYPDGTLENINSSHSHRAMSELSKLVADLFPYKGALEFNKDHPSLKFNDVSGLVTWGDQEITPLDDLTYLPDDVKLFCETVRTPETISAYESSRSPEYEMETKIYRRVEYINGKPTLVRAVKKVPKMRKVRVVNEDGTLAFDRRGRKLFVGEKILKGA